MTRLTLAHLLRPRWDLDPRRTCHPNALPSTAESRSPQRRCSGRLPGQLVAACCLVRPAHATAMVDVIRTVMPAIEAVEASPDHV
jgi:hypothetical protein